MHLNRKMLHTHVCVYIYIDMHVHIYTCSCLCIYTCTHTHIYIYIYTYVHVNKYVACIAAVTRIPEATKRQGQPSVLMLHSYSEAARAHMLACTSRFEAEGFAVLLVRGTDPFQSGTSDLPKRVNLHHTIGGSLCLDAGRAALQIAKTPRFF